MKMFRVATAHLTLLLLSVRCSVLKGLAFRLQRASSWPNSRNPPAQKQRTNNPISDRRFNIPVPPCPPSPTHPAPVPVTLAGIIVRNQICSCSRSAVYHLRDLPHPLPKTQPCIPLCPRVLNAPLLTLIYLL